MKHKTGTKHMQIITWADISRRQNTGMKIKLFALWTMNAAVPNTSKVDEWA